MKSMRKLGSTLVLGCAVGALVLGSMSLMAPKADAKAIIGPLCGPTYIWVCTGKGKPVKFIGTVCDKLVFETKTGKTCVPYSG